MVRDSLSRIGRRHMANLEALERSRTIALLSSGHLQSPDGRVQPIVAPVCLRAPTTTSLGCRTLEPQRGLHSVRDRGGMIYCVEIGALKVPSVLVTHHHPKSSAQS